MNEPQPKPIVLRPSVSSSDNLGDLLAEGAIDIDDLSAQAIRDEEIQESRRKATEATAYLDDPDWEPPYVIEGSDF
ncbi:MAG: hypothetical protein KME28_00115 [Pelatocladus maniniholoensis HA4357-MV3]|jgi:hypothetical protein|uniref:Uncharacterized protein n=1 Tax=Pelatocladus maniniholoensis HA4357-MV3 TaxID=1117104 RepID=A0A9E3H2F0_9NOST|nr:hypothetical protein [Pelatocladus maniniholoensis HA4357-MV3]